MTHLFVSHSRADRTMAEMLAARLQDDGFRPWLDTHHIPGGDQWEEAIHRAIKTAAVVLVAVTPDSAHSRWVRRELELARSAGRPIVPLRLRGDAGEDLVALGIEHLQCVDFAREGFERGLSALRQALNGLIPAADRWAAVEVLLVDDEASSRRAIGQVLDDLGVRATSAETFDGAIALLRARPFHLALVDMQLETGDRDGQFGRLLLREFRVHHSRTPVIIVSSLPWTGKEVASFLRRQGVRDYVQKPFDPEELRESIVAALTPR